MDSLVAEDVTIMPIPGATVFEILKSGLAEVLQQATAAREEAVRVDRQMAELVTRRSEAVIELARVALPELSRTAVDQGFAEVRQDLHTIVERKERRAKEVGDRLERLRQVADGMQAKAGAATEAVSQAIARQEQSRLQVTKALAEDAVFQVLSQQALRTEAELKRDEERVVEIASEAREKRPAYEKSRLFQYLTSQRYGEAEYAGRGLVRRLDRWVGRLIEFDKATRSYRFLLTTPTLMDAETARRKTEFHGLMQKVEDLERIATEEAGVAEAIQAVHEATTVRERMQAELAEDQKRVHAAEQELAALDQQQGQFYEEALSRLKAFLAKAATELLERRAAMTPDPADDELTLKIRILSDDIAGMEPRLAQQKEASLTAVKISGGLEHIARRFEQATFQETRSFFADGYDIRRSIEQYRARALSRDAFWDEIKRNQERVPTDFEKRASKTITAAMNGPLSGALAEAMLNVAGAALGQSVGRSISRRQAFGDAQRVSDEAAEGGARWVRKDAPQK